MIEQRCLIFLFLTKWKSQVEFEEYSWASLESPFEKIFTKSIQSLFLIWTVVNFYFKKSESVRVIHTAVPFSEKYS